MIRVCKVILVLLTIAAVSQSQTGQDSLPCDKTCQTCLFGQGPQQCDSCSSGSNRDFIMSSLTCTCSPSYYDNGQAVCPPCNYVCATCSVNDTNCDSCNDNRGATPSCTCLQQYYDDGSTTNCLACHYTCESCTSSDHCSSCDINKNRLLTALSPFCLCDDRFYDNGVEICSSCDSKCFRCSGPNSSDCTACNSAAYRILQSNFCVCSVGFFSSSSAIEQCQSCSYSCLTCSSTSTCDSCDVSINRVLMETSCPCSPQYFENISMLCELCDKSCATCVNLTSCTTCISSQLTTISNSGLCSCNSSQFWNSNACAACNYTCLTCVGSASACSSCAANSNRFYSNGTCACTGGYYDSGNIACLSCNSTCFTCDYSLNCSSCDSLMNRQLTAGQCSCLSGYYNSGSNVVCLACSYKCLTCNGPASCSSCNLTLNRSLNNSTGFCECNTFYFQSGQTCLPCASNCLTCSNNATCTSCNSSLFRTLNSSNHCDCQSGYYLNQANVCAPCGLTCATCNSSLTCLTCKQNLNRVLNSTSSTCDCSLGFVLILTSNLCAACQYSCSYCVSNYTNRCSSCNSSSFRTLNAASFQCQCNNGYYDDGKSSLCQKCSYTCKTCAGSANQCASCPTSSNRIYSSSAKTCICAQHYYDNIINYIQNANCLACPYSCSSCVWASTCASCNSTLFRIMNQTGGCVCQLNYYDNGSVQKCLACNYKCQTCTNSTSCLTCDSSTHRDTPNSTCPCVSGYYDAANQTTCFSCQYTCATCSAANICLTCETTYQRSYNSTTKLCICNQRYFDIGNQNCSACTYSCLSCSNTAIQCSTCNASAMRTFNSVLKSCLCNAGYFDNAIQQCYLCQYSCATCSNNQTCLTCNTTKYRIMDNKTGLCICSTGYYDNNTTQTCQVCQSTCLTCTNNTHCLTCDVNRNRVLNGSADYANAINLFCPCLLKYYSLGLNSCSACHFSCAYCSGPNITNCLFCGLTFYRIMASGSTTCICKDGYYDTNATQMCLACHTACLTCFNNLNTTCFTCNSTNFIILNTTICYSTCPITYYSNTTSMLCSLCSANCLHCINSTFCTTCNTSTFLHEAVCLAECPLKYYGDTTNNTCVLCRVGCANCSLATNCFKCVNTSYYVDFPTTQCLLCSTECVTCFGPFPNQCLNCTYPLYLNSQYTCANLTCPYGKYVDTFKGCVNCGELFNFSLTCNISSAFLCSGTYQLKNGLCQPCNSVTGYAIDFYGDCSQICGDGIIIYYQCDDGNNLNGDGCSANCVIESGWTCLNSSNISVCDLTSGVSMGVQRWIKYPGTNKLRLIISISLPLRLTNINFALSIININPNDYLCNLMAQDQSNLAELIVDIIYSSSIESKSINLTYQKGLKVQSNSIRRLLLNSTGVSTVFAISSFPPANFISSSTINTYNLISLIITSLSIGLLVLNLIIVPKVYALHSISMVWISPFIFFTYFYSTNYTTEWISKIISQTQLESFYYGFSFGSCCSIDTFKNTSSQLSFNIGYIVIFLLLNWLIFGIIKIFFNCSSSQNQSKWQTIFNYYIFTIHLIVLPQLCYSSLYSLSNFRLSNKIDAFNATLSLLILFFVVFLIGALWYLTKISIFTGSYKQMSSKATRNSGDKQLQNTVQNESKIIGMQKQEEQILQDKSDFNISKTFMFRRSATNGFKRSQDQIDIISHDEQTEEAQLFFLFDYCFFYNNSHQYSKYFLPLLMTKIVFTLLIVATLSNFPFRMMLITTIVNVIFLCFLVKVRPFQSTFTNFKLILVQILLLTTNAMYTVYQYFANQNIYAQILQTCVLIGIICILGFAVIFSLIEHYKAWIHKIWKLCEDCCLCFRLKGPSTKIYDRDDHSSNVIKIQTVNQSEMGQVDAFYARVLQKNALNRQYQRQRMLHHRRVQKDLA